MQRPFLWAPFYSPHLHQREDPPITVGNILWSLRYTEEAIDAAKKQDLEAFECVSRSKSSTAKLEQAVRQENLRDLLSVLAIGLAFPSIDTLFGRYRFKVIARGELWRTYEELFREGVLAEGNAAVAIPGPNWEIPEFMIDKRYEE
ncbi:hypothetical protein ACIP86_11250 [Pseudomonas neuropathica]